VLHWHGDLFELPENAASLASTPDCPHQAFSIGRNLLGVQFHPEVTAEGLETWYVGHYRGINASPELSAAGLRQDARRHASGLRERGTHMLLEWLQQLVMK
jgi:GMP synthase (glutamine-hydrolysing)